MNLLSKLKAKIWTSYIYKINSSKFVINEILKSESLIKIDPPEGYIMSADPSFLDKENILIECVSKKTALGCIFLINWKKNISYKLDLNESYHYSFPLYYSINNKNYITFQSNIDNGLVIYKYDEIELKKNKIFLKNLKRVYLMNNTSKMLVDPVLLFYKDNIHLFGSTKEEPYLSKCIGQLEIKNNNLNLNEEKIIFKPIKGRLGGDFIYKEKEIIAITQMFNKSYGDGIKQFKIIPKNEPLEIKTIVYEDKNFYGPHTFNYSPCGNYIIFDICEQSFEISNMISKIRQYLKR